MQDLVIKLDTARKLLEECVKAYKNTGRQLAETERKYRVAYRQEIFRLHETDGVAWTACDTLARGDEEVSKLRFERDVKKSDYEVCYEKILQLKTEIRILENEIAAMRGGI